MLVEYEGEYVKVKYEEHEIDDILRLFNFFNATAIRNIKLTKLHLMMRAKDYFYMDFKGNNNLIEALKNL